MSLSFDGASTEILNLLVSHSSADSLDTATDKIEREVQKHTHRIQFKHKNRPGPLIQVQEIGLAEPLEDELQSTGTSIWAAAIILSWWMLVRGCNCMHLTQNRT